MTDERQTGSPPEERAANIAVAAVGYGMPESAAESLGHIALAAIREAVAAETDRCAAALSRVTCRVGHYDVANRTQFAADNMADLRGAMLAAIRARGETPP
jgi:hypothetical protein